MTVQITKLYVLWVNLNGGKADYAVGTSTIPEGPFKFSNYANAQVNGWAGYRSRYRKVSNRDI